MFAATLLTTRTAFDGSSERQPDVAPTPVASKEAAAAPATTQTLEGMSPEDVSIHPDKSRHLPRAKLVF